MQFEEIKNLIAEECEQYGVTFHHGTGPTVDWNGVECNGYISSGYEEIPVTLAVATNDNSLDTLIHESCHMDQWYEQTPEWMDLEDHGQVWEWLCGVDDFTEEELDESVMRSYRLEVDCERRSVEKHRMWKTGVNESEYIQKANAYTMFYFYMRENRVWYKAGNEPYSLKEVWGHMPETFNFNRLDWYTKTHHLFAKCV